MFSRRENRWGKLHWKKKICRNCVISYYLKRKTYEHLLKSERLFGSFSPCFKKSFRWKIPMCIYLFKMQFIYRTYARCKTKISQDKYKPCTKYSRIFWTTSSCLLSRIRKSHWKSPYYPLQPSISEWLFNTNINKMRWTRKNSGIRRK